MTNEEMLTIPLVAIGGETTDKGTLVIYMHKGFDRPLLALEAYVDRADREERGDNAQQVGGSREHPFASWPVYAMWKPRAEVNL